MVALLLFLPDSPKYLISQEKTTEARKSLQWLRGKNYNVDPEMSILTEENLKESEIGSISLKQLFSQRVYWQPFCIAMFGMFGQQFCGINVVLFYLQPIFEKAKSSVDPSE